MDEVGEEAVGMIAGELQGRITAVREAAGGRARMEGNLRSLAESDWQRSKEGGRAKGSGRVGGRLCRVDG